MTELDAINTLLEAIGETEVDDLDSEFPEAQRARKALAQVSRQVQQKGWAFNTERNLKFPVAEDGTCDVSELPYPDGPEVLDVQPSSPFVRYSVRQGKYWNLGKHTAVVNEQPGGYVLSDARVYFSWGDLPPVVQQYITVKAARHFQEKVLGSDTLGKFNERDEQEALVDFQRYDASLADYNILDSDELISTVRGYHR